MRRRAPGKRPIESGETATPPARPRPRRRNRSRLRRRPRRRRSILSFDALADGAKQRATARPNPDEALEQLLGPAPEAPARPGRRRPLSELRAEAERRADAEENVRAGRAHPLLFDFLRNARDRLTPEATRIAESLPLGAAETTKGWARGYLKGVADAHHGAVRAAARRPTTRWAAPAPTCSAGTTRRNVRRSRGPSSAPPRFAWASRRITPSSRRCADRRGTPRSIAWRSTRSQAAGDARPVTPDVRPALACYRVRVSAYRMPPLPAVGLDLASGRIIYPLKRITKVTVELQSVDFGAKRQAPSFLDVRSR